MSKSAPCSERMNANNSPKRSNSSFTSDTISYNHVKKLFIDNENKKHCYHSILYINDTFTPSVRKNINCIQMIDECHHFYNVSSDQSHVYIYGGDMLNQVIYWLVEHGKQAYTVGHLGLHVSIGLKEDGNLDIHQTIYETTKVDKKKC